MATIAYGLLSSLNNTLCDTGLKGTLTLPLMPVLFGGLNPVVIILIVITAALIRYTGDDNFQNYDGTSRSFKRSFLFSLLWWYVALFVIFLIYKIFGCPKTVGRTRAYSQFTDFKNISGKGGLNSLVEEAFNTIGKQ